MLNVMIKTPGLTLARDFTPLMALNAKPRLPVRLLKYQRSMICDTRLIACEHVRRLTFHLLNCVHDALLRRAFL